MSIPGKRCFKYAIDRPRYGCTRSCIHCRCFLPVSEVKNVKKKRAEIDSASLSLQQLIDMLILLHYFRLLDMVHRLLADAAPTGRLSIVSFLKKFATRNQQKTKVMRTREELLHLLRRIEVRVERWLVFSYSSSWSYLKSTTLSLEKRRCQYSVVFKCFNWVPPPAQQYQRLSIRYFTYHASNLTKVAHAQFTSFLFMLPAFTIRPMYFSLTFPQT